MKNLHYKYKQNNTTVHIKIQSYSEKYTDKKSQLMEIAWDLSDRFILIDYRTHMNLLSHQIADHQHHLSQEQCIRPR